MARGWWIRFSLMSVLTLLAALMITPTLFNLDEKGPFPVKQKINLGLDLQGGLYMVLGIDFDKVYADEVLGQARRAIKLLEENGMRASLGASNTSDANDPKQTIVLENASDADRARSKIREFYSYPLRLTKDGGAFLTYGLGRDYLREIEESAVSKSIEVIRNRIDEFGVTEPEIVSQGRDRIVVQLPGVKDVERAKELIGKTAKLEFKFVNDSISPATISEWMDEVKASGLEFNKGERFSDYVKKVNEILKDKLPAAHQIAFTKIVSKVSNDIVNFEPYLIESSSALTGDELQDASVRIDPEQNRPYVSLDFKASGAKTFEQVTGANIGRRLAIVLDDNVYSAPVVQAKIAGGSAQISLGSGDYNTVMTEARDLALVLRAGALPVELVFEEQRVVGPSLGHDAIEKAEVAAVIGSFLVFAFIIFYYKASGTIACIAIILNAIFQLAILIMVGATLSLPGIAGIALTVGMAVDGNIIVYERIREELRAGASPFEAMKSGFDKAFWAILDANITTAFAGLCLLNFGTGPVRGFAVTLLIGIVTTVYTSYFASKIMFDWHVKPEKKKLSI